jgi:hypothetical protein
MQKLPTTGRGLFGHPLQSHEKEAKKPPSNSGGGGSGLTRYNIEFDRTNEVEPGDPIQDEEGTLNLLQEGTHVLGGHKRVINSNRVGVVGDGKVVLKPPEGKWVCPWVFRSSQDVLIANLTLHQRDDRKSGIGFKALVGDGLEAHHIRTRGTMTDEEHCGNPGQLDGSTISFAITNPNGSGVYANCDYRAYGPVEDYPTGISPHYVGPSHSGVLWVNEPTVVDSAMHTFYASRSSGEIHVRGGLLKNNSNTNMRLSRNSTIKGTTIVIDAPQEEFVASNGDPQNVRGIRWERAKWNGSSGGLIENCRLVCRSDVLGQGLIAVDGSAGELTIRNCEFVNTTRTYRNIIVEKVGDNRRNVGPPRGNWVLVENCSLTGGGQPLVTDKRGSTRIQ